MKMFRWGLAALLGACCAILSGGTAHASEPQTPQYFEQYAEDFLEFAAEIEHGQSFVYAPGVTDFTLAERAGTQSAEELEEMQTNERPAVFLTMDDGTIVSGAYTDTTEHARIAVDWLYGCNRVANACLYTENGNRMGYKDKGYLAVRVPNTRIVAAGNTATLFTRDSGARYYVLPGKQMRMEYLATIVSIER